MSDSNDAISALVNKLLDLRGRLHGEGTHPRDALDAVRQACAQIQVKLLLAGRSNELLVDEALRRDMSCLRWLDDKTLLGESERRGVAMIQSEMSVKEFRAEAHKRGFRQHLSDFPLNEVRSYVRLQDGEV